VGHGHDRSPRSSSRQTPNSGTWACSVKSPKNTKVDVSVIGKSQLPFAERLPGRQPAQTGGLPGAHRAVAAPGALWPWVSDPASAAAAGVPYPYPGFCRERLDGHYSLPASCSDLGTAVCLSAIRSATPTTKPCRSASPSAPVMDWRFQGSYVLSATHGNTDTAFEELWWTGSIQNLYDLQQERNGISSFDTTHVIKGYVIYDLPRWPPQGSIVARQQRGGRRGRWLDSQTLVTITLAARPSRCTRPIGIRDSTRCTST